MDLGRFATPVEDRFFEDYVVGAVHRFGSVLVDQDEIIEFAVRFDPQPFHTDPEAAKAGHFGGLVASGWHTAGLMMRLMSEYFVSKVAGLGSPGIDELRWLKPVRPGDILSVQTLVTSAVPSRSKADRGMIHVFIEVINQADEVVMSLKALMMVRRRPLQLG